MKIVVCHLTRMEIGYVCAAGIEVESGRHIRTVLRDGRLTTRFLSVEGGPFDIGAMVDLGEPRPVRATPHVEDHVIDPRQVVVMGQTSAEQFWSLLEGARQTALRDVFGGEIEHLGRSRYGLREGRGVASLGLLRPSDVPRLHLVEDPRFGRTQIRMEFSAGDGIVDAGVTDIRLYQDNHVIPDAATCETLSRRITESRSILLGLGLTRAFASTPDREPVHWLQVNNIHLVENPVWQLGVKARY